MQKNTCKLKQQTPAFNLLLAFFLWPVYLPYYFLTIFSGSTRKCNVTKRGKRGKRGKVGKRGEKGQKGERGNASNPVISEEPTPIPKPDDVEPTPIPKPDDVEPWWSDYFNKDNFMVGSTKEQDFENFRRYYKDTFGDPPEGISFRELMLDVFNKAITLGYYSYLGQSKKLQQEVDSDFSQYISELVDRIDPVTKARVDKSLSVWASNRSIWGLEFFESVYDPGVTDATINGSGVLQVIGKHANTLEDFSFSSRDAVKPYTTVFNPMTNQLDSKLVKFDVYDNLDSISEIFRRTPAVLMLKHDPSTNRYVCDLSWMNDSVEMRPTQNVQYYQHGCKVYLSEKQLEVVEICLDGDNPVYIKDVTVPRRSVLDIVCKRVVSSIYFAMTVSIHAAIQHHVISGEWIYQYCDKVLRKDLNHPLLPLLAPLTQGALRTNFKGHFTLISNTEWNTFACMYSTTTESVVNVHKQFRQDNDTLLDHTYFPQIYDRISHQNMPTLPILNSYQLWWNLIEANVSNFVDVYYHTDDDLDQGLVEFISKVNPFDQGAPKGADFLDAESTFLIRSLKKIITMMHFNNVLHEMISANQSAFDVINRKRYHKVSKNTQNGEESLLNALLAISINILTVFPGITYTQRSLSYLVKDGNADAKVALDSFYKDILEMQQKYETEFTDEDYVTLLQPKNVDMSVSW